MGVPVVTVAGDRPQARMGVSILTTAGCADWIATDGSGLVAITERLAGDLGMLQAIRGSLRAKLSASPLLDGKGFARAFEQAVRAIRSHPFPAPSDPPA
jgi:protein O-GlcNAc transferase